MTNEEIIQKAKDLGLSEEEINQFIENQKIAQKYGFDGEYSSINVKIEKNVNINKELSEESENDCCCETEKNHSCDCEHHCCKEHHDCNCECEHDCKCNHHNLH